MCGTSKEYGIYIVIIIWIATAAAAALVAAAFFLQPCCALYHNGDATNSLFTCPLLLLTCVRQIKDLVVSSWIWSSYLCFEMQKRELPQEWKGKHKRGSFLKLVLYFLFLLGDNNHNKTHKIMKEWIAWHEIMISVENLWKHNTFHNKRVWKGWWQQAIPCLHQ